MIRGPLYDEGYRPKLSGHETFPLRYGWLKKAYDALSDSREPYSEAGSLLCRGCRRTFWCREEHGCLNEALGECCRHHAGGYCS